MSGPDSVPMQSLASLKLEGWEGAAHGRINRQKLATWKSKKDAAVLLQQGACLVWTSDLQGDLSAPQSREPASSKRTPVASRPSTFYLFLSTKCTLHQSLSSDALTVNTTIILSGTTYRLQVPLSPTLVPACKTSCIGRAKVPPRHNKSDAADFKRIT